MVEVICLYVPHISCAGEHRCQVSVAQLTSRKHTHMEMIHIQHSTCDWPPGHMFSFNCKIHLPQQRHEASNININQNVKQITSQRQKMPHSWSSCWCSVFFSTRTWAMGCLRAMGTLTKILETGPSWAIPKEETHAALYGDTANHNHLTKLGTGIVRQTLLRRSVPEQPTWL